MHIYPLVYCDRDDLKQFFSFDCSSADYKLHDKLRKETHAL